MQIIYCSTYFITRSNDAYTSFSTSRSSSLKYQYAFIFALFAYKNNKYIIITEVLKTWTCISGIHNILNYNPNRSSAYSDRHRIKIYFILIVITRCHFRNNYSAWAFVFDVLITRNPSEFGKTLDLTSRTAIYSCRYNNNIYCNYD